MLEVREEAQKHCSSKKQDRALSACSISFWRFERFSRCQFKWSLGPNKTHGNRKIKENQLFFRLNHRLHRKTSTATPRMVQICSSNLVDQQQRLFLSKFHDFSCFTKLENSWNQWDFIDFLCQNINISTYMSYIIYINYCLFTNILKVTKITCHITHMHCAESWDSLAIHQGSSHAAVVLMGSYRIM